MSKLKVDQISKATGASPAIFTLPATDGTVNQLMKTDGAGQLGWATDTGGLFSGYALFADQKAQDTDGGTFTLGAWRQRDLNTTIANTDTTNITLGTNDFTLLAGSYLIQWSAPFYNVRQNQTRLYDVTGTASVEVGSSEYGGATTNVRSFGLARVTPGSSNVYRIEHWCTTTQAGDGFGLKANIDTEQYAMVSIFKEA